MTEETYVLGSYDVQGFETSDSEARVEDDIGISVRLSYFTYTPRLSGKKQRSKLRQDAKEVRARHPQVDVMQKMHDS